MSIVHTVELRAPLERYRLQNDGSWRPIPATPNIGFEKRLLDSDFRTDDPYEVAYRADGLNETLVLGGKSYSINRTSFSMAEMLELAHSESFVFRRMRPALPQIDQLRSEIAMGDEPGLYRILLLHDARFKLESDENERSRHAPLHAVHSNAYSGEDFFGVDAAADDRHVNQLFKRFLCAWLFHLDFGKSCVFLNNVDDNKPVEQINGELHQFLSAWAPEF